MIQRLAVVSATLCAFFAACAGGAAASPAPGGDPGLCNFALSAPSLVVVSGTQMVTATLTPKDCTGIAESKSAQVCVATTDSVGRCVNKQGFGTAQVYFSPYLPGVRYTATGRGCAAVSSPATAICSSLGPISAAL